MKALGKQKHKYFRQKEEEKRIKERAAREAYLASLTDEEREKVLAAERKRTQRALELLTLPYITGTIGKKY